MTILISGNSLRNLLYFLFKGISKMDKQILFLAFSAVLAASSAQATDTGFYVGGSFGQSKVNDFNGADIDAELLAGYGLTSSTSTDDTDTGWKAFAGYRFSKHLAVEGAYTNLGETTANTVITAPGAGTINTTLEAGGLTVSALGILPLGSNFSLFGRLGVNFWNIDVTATGAGSGGAASASDNDDGTDWVYGVGAAYSINKNLSLRGEWERYDFGDGDVDLLSAGVSWSF